MTTPGDELAIIEVPVTRKATAVRVGILHRWGGSWSIDCEPGKSVSAGDELACRVPGGGFRNGTARVRPDLTVGFTCIAASADGDIVYRVEPA